MHKPLVWLPACHRNLDLSDPGGYIVLADRYAEAVAEMDLQPVLFPLAGAGDVDALLPLVDGVLLTGSPSNVEATHYGGTALPTDLLDPRRDALTMRLVRAAIDSAVPLFGVCRGLQEINVALGGTLHQQVHAQEGLLDHREPEDEPLEVQFGHRHEIRIEAGSALEDWAGGTTAQVNSLHGQGINRLGTGLVAEAFAPDGLVEAVRVQGSASFAYGVQWHPEWRHATTPFYARTFEAFARACRERCARRKSSA
ncbi:gamma-glutamyl-gamma-aminobutyrate hydrolase family protein [Ramlibacter sp. AW1]|uniref:gamma-glutamyl-gamma-aminobutyrate hydrolase n=1 Tax=Ramlibacter aurantiacus TaxID=2801330 RepID=A0A936ZQI3_9BURK|nr:gamma-glutamyl-gamma-aminobutyrate hydrolase family protein [Ramlibacter aurantiacus]MBL0421735.1 gamma-glutamyl-gamma-aminobutyrate hydrolase family protein [Ramlibacter aurantiacus]